MNVEMRATYKIGIGSRKFCIGALFEILFSRELNIQAFVDLHELESKMAKRIPCRNQKQESFCKRFLSICETKSPWAVWSDFIQLIACTLSNGLGSSVPFYMERENLYLKVISNYNKEQSAIFPELFAQLVLALEENPEQDFLGDAFMALGLGSNWKGQFFTPYHISKAMAEMMLSGMEKNIEEMGWISINDPACGAGSMLIAARNCLNGKGFGSDCALFVAQDIDRTVALMCFIQLSLLGCAGYVIIADSLRHPPAGKGNSPLLLTPTPEQEVWITPALYSNTWTARIIYEHERLLLDTAAKDMKYPHEKEAANHGKGRGKNP